jgi:signal transduction histidine kinase
MMKFERGFSLRGAFGQTVLLVSAALLVAQAIGFLLLVNERDRWRLLDAIQPAVEHFVATARQIEQAPPAKRLAAAFQNSRPEQHFMIFRQSAIAMFRLTREHSLEVRLKAALASEGLKPKAVEASSIGFANSPPNEHRVRSVLFGPPGGAMPPPQGMRFDGVPPDFHRSGGGPRGIVIGPGPFPPWGPFDRERAHPFGPSLDESRQEIDLSIQLDDGTWLNGRFLSVRPSSYFISRLIIAELILFGTVLTVTLVLAMRLARPLARLASASDQIGPDGRAAPVPEKGPRDVRAAIRSFNAMTARVSDLLREKDRMLGAIGHDLRTPIASLRIRAEAVEPEAERAKIVETLEDMTRMVEEILELARLGRSDEEFKLTDIAALADAVVEEFQELGKDVTFHDSPRAVVRIQPVLVRRLLRNLIENAVKFGKRARVRVELQDGATQLVVMDDGPGIPPEEMERVFEPFTRLETSRSRETGGSGLGLSIAQSIARSQGAQLRLENAPAGLIARVLWPPATG